MGEALGEEAAGLLSSVELATFRCGQADGEMAIQVCFIVRRPELVVVEQVERAGDDLVGAGEVFPCSILGWVRAVQRHLNGAKIYNLKRCSLNRSSTTGASTLELPNFFTASSARLKAINA